MPPNKKKIQWCVRACSRPLIAVAQRLCFAFHPTWQRLFAMNGITINKAQGQTIMIVGMYLLEKVYSHG
jgi:hypothetical protein